MGTRKRRGAGEGSVYFVQGRGWVGSIDLGWENGKRRRKMAYGGTQAEVIEKMLHAKATLASGVALPNLQLSTGDFLTRWSREHLPTAQMKESTAEQYRQIVDSYLVPHVGHVRLAKLGPAHVHKLQVTLAERGLSPSTIRYARAVLSGALSHAERWGYVTRNVVRLVDAPKKPQPKTDDVLTLDEARALRRSAQGHRLEALVTVALAVGLRRGEALALRWEDFDQEAKTLTIRGTLKRRPGGGLYVDTPKSRTTAVVPLPTVCVAALVVHRRRQAHERLSAGPAWQQTDHIFVTPIGTPIDGSNALRIFYALCAEAGIGRRRFHCLRHSAATIMWEQGVPLDVISATLRHSGLSITKDIYVTFRADVMRSGADAMDRALMSTADPA